MKISFAQCNPTVGDLDGNARLILRHLRQAQENGCDLAVFPELVLTGYPPEDLLLKPAFIAENRAALKSLAARVGATAAVVGFVDEIKGKRYNAAAWLENKKIRTIYHKTCLPNYGVFDEQRYFSAGERPVVVPFRGRKIGLTICEDIWLGNGPLSPLKKLKPDAVINISASPFHAGKLSERHTIAAQAARFLKAPVMYCNMVGGQDELVFDGGGFVVDKAGRVTAQFPLFEEDLYAFDLPAAPGKQNNTAPMSRIDQIHRALLLGIRDYVNKNGFEKVALGLSGGIDSALVAVLAAQALGPARVTAVTMPSKFNSRETHGDAKRLAHNLGIELLDIAIQPVYDVFLKTLDPYFKNTAANMAEENIQARIRGTLLMALSNKFGWLVLTTGNKSEMSTGYCTLYGDTAGGFAVLKDVLKTTVYALSKRINEKAGRDIIPLSTIERRPTAELKADQFDEDSLGAYRDLDPLIVDYVEKNKAPGNNAYAKKIISMIDRSEYKRRQAPPGIKITPRSFGRDHRMPITNRYSPR
jgi:NAD+ synthase (glutamine-hydrolysing)